MSPGQALLYSWESTGQHIRARSMLSENCGESNLSRPADLKALHKQEMRARAELQTACEGTDTQRLSAKAKTHEPKASKEILSKH